MSVNHLKCFICSVTLCLKHMYTCIHTRASAAVYRLESRMDPIPLWLFRSLSSPSSCIWTFCPRKKRKSGDLPATMAAWAVAWLTVYSWDFSSTSLRRFSSVINNNSFCSNTNTRLFTRESFVMKAHLIADLSAFGNQSDKPVCFVKLPFFKVNWTHCWKLITNGDISGCEQAFFMWNDISERAGWLAISLSLLRTTRFSSFTSYKLFSLFFFYSLPSIYWKLCIACCMEQHCIKLNDFSRRLHTLCHKKSCCRKWIFSLCIFCSDSTLQVI